MDIIHTDKYTCEIGWSWLDFTFVEINRENLPKTHTNVGYIMGRLIQVIDCTKYNYIASYMELIDTFCGSDIISAFFILRLFLYSLVKDLDTNSVSYTGGPATLNVSNTN
jgi:hypothetical protein